MLSKALIVAEVRTACLKPSLINLIFCFASQQLLIEEQNSGKKIIHLEYKKENLWMSCH